MNKYYFKGMVLVAVLVISACAPRVRPTSIDDAASWTDIVPLNTMVQLSREGEPVDLNEVLASEENVRQALNTLFPAASGIDNIRDRINAIREDKSGGNRRLDELGVLRGLGGLFAFEFLNSVDATLDEEGQYDPDKRVYEFFYGHTREFEFDRDEGTGHILNFTYFTRVVVAGDNTPIISTTNSYRWNVDVEQGGFTVVEKGSDPDNPFPDTLEFSDEMLNRIDALGFEYKLWATGTPINIVDVAFKPHGAASYTSLPTSDSRYDRVDTNCIDMLFVNFPPPVLGTLQPPLYCLGRCQDPMLINTGV